MKRFLFFIVVPFLVLNGFFVANMQNYAELRRYADHPALAVVSAGFVLLFALPSFCSVVGWLGARRGGLTLVVLGAFAVGIETFAVVTGFPYGGFSYGEKIGYKLFGLTPWTVPFAWTPILLACFALARRYVREPLRLLALTALLTVVVDLTLDPGAVSQGFWKYDAPGAYYGVPLSNFVGWMLSGAIGAAILQGIVRRDGAPPVGWMTSAWLILVFWSSVCAWSRLWIAALVGLISLAVLSKFLFFHATAEDAASSGA